MTTVDIFREEKKEFVLITYLFICSYTFYIFICNNNMYLEQRRDGATMAEEGMLKECYFLLFLTHLITEASSF